MKIIKKIGAQGDMIAFRVAKLPSTVTKADDLIVAHSETGHHHIAVGNATRYTTADPLVGFLVATGDVQIQHLRTFDTHETLELRGEPEGEVVWEIRRQREWSPEGWRKVED